MSFLGDLFGGGDSSSSSTQSTSNADNRMVLGEGSNNASAGSVINNTTYALDGGVIQNVVGSTGKSVAQALDFGNNALSLSDNNGARGLATTNSAFNFGADILGGAASLVDKNSSKAFDFSLDVLGGAASLVDKNSSRSFDFVGNAIDTFVNFASKASATAADSQRDSLQAATGAFDNALNYSNATSNRAMQSVAGAFSDALDFTGKSSNKAIEALAQSNAMVKDSYAEAKGRGAMTDYILFAALAVAAIVAYRGMR